MGTPVVCPAAGARMVGEAANTDRPGYVAPWTPFIGRTRIGLLCPGEQCAWEVGGRARDRGNVKTTVFRVARMDCGAEEQLVRLRLDDVEGIESVMVDLDERTVAVRHSTDPALIEEALDGLDLGATRLADTGERAADDQRVVSDERRILRAALIINAGFFVAEFGAGLIARSMGLLGDSLDMLADASVYSLSLLAVGRPSAHKKRLAAGSGYLQFGLAAVGLVEVIRRLLINETLPDVRTMIVVSVLALVANVVTLVILRKAKSPEAHFQASWIFTANDIKVNALVIASAVIVALTGSAIPDLLAGAGIFVIVANGARRILRLVR